MKYRFNRNLLCRSVKFWFFIRQCVTHYNLKFISSRDYNWISFSFRADIYFILLIKWGIKGHPMFKRPAAHLLTIWHSFNLQNFMNSVVFFQKIISLIHTSTVLLLWLMFLIERDFCSIKSISLHLIFYYLSFLVLSYNSYNTTQNVWCISFNNVKIPKTKIIYVCLKLRNWIYLHFNSLLNMPIKYKDLPVPSPSILIPFQHCLQTGN